jgi:hypothetical protein
MPIFSLFFKKIGSVVLVVLTDDSQRDESTDKRLWFSFSLFRVAVFGTSRLHQTYIVVNADVFISEAIPNK